MFLNQISARHISSRLRLCTLRIIHLTVNYNIVSQLANAYSTKLIAFIHAIDVQHANCIRSLSDEFWSHHYYQAVHTFFLQKRCENVSAAFYHKRADVMVC